MLLWVALQLLPARPVDPPHVYSDDSGTVAARPEPTPTSRAPSLFSPGNVAALLLLGGGVSLAVYLRRRTATADDFALMKPVGELALGTGERLRLVECGGEILLLGVTSSQVNLLRSYPVDRFDLPEPDAGDAASFPNTHFAEVLQRFAPHPLRSESNGSTC